MDSTTTTIKSYHSSTGYKPNNNVSAKLRRLKIQEGLLLQNIKKDISNHCTDDTAFIESCLDFKKFVNHIKNSYTTIRNLLEDVKIATQSEELLKSLDLNDIKRDIFDLDEKLKSLKIFLQSEQSVLTQQEQEIMEKINEFTNQNHKIKVIKAVTSKCYSDIVPSPVKNLINSPLKCQEVQNFQDFLSVTNKFGGWNEYHHNMFVKFWQKHVKKVDIDTINSDSLDGPVFNQLTDDFLSKVPGFKRPDVVAHIKWYSRYLYLKSCQQRALEEWRAKNKPPKAARRIEEKKEVGKNGRANCSSKRHSSGDSQKSGRQESTGNTYTSENKAGSSSAKDQYFLDSVNTGEYLKQLNKSLEASGILSKYDNLECGYTKSTKQWDMRCKNVKDSELQKHGIEHVTKLGIPTWRLSLQEY